jgi:hypothetical protein
MMDRPVGLALTTNRTFPTCFLTKPKLSRDASGTDDAFRWHTSNVQAIASHQVTLNQSNASTKARRTGSGYQPSRTGTDDDQVIGLARRRIPPLRRMNVRFELLIVFVARLKLNKIRG